jgi:hypothetical protein
MNGKIFEWLSSWIGETAAKFVFSFVRIFVTAFLFFLVAGLAGVHWSLPFDWKLFGAVIIGVFPQVLKLLALWLATLLEKFKKAE